MKNVQAVNVHVWGSRAGAVALGTRALVATHLHMAKAAGIEMSPCRLFEENGRAHFMTRRFDRDIVDGTMAEHHLQTL
jgi:hypothetical protein